MREFEVFWAITVAENFTKAGQMLGISQPAVSRYIRHAEDVLGYKLFVRKSGRLRPSPEAELLIPVVSTIFDRVESARKVAQELKSGRVGSVKIAAESTPASDLITKAIGGFLRERPRVNVCLKILARSEVVARVIRGQVDLGLVYTPVTEGNLQILDLYSTELVAVVPKGHPLAEKPVVTPNDLVGERLISANATSWCGRRLEEVFISCGIPRWNAVDCGHSMISYTLVSENAGVAIVQPLHGSVYQHLGVVVKPFRPAVAITAQLFYRNDRPLSQLAAAFVNKLHKAARQPLIGGEKSTTLSARHRLNGADKAAATAAFE